MKKFFLACGVSALMFSAVSCNGGSNVEAKGFDDSVSVCFGKHYGLGLSNELKSLPENYKGKMDKKAIIKGVELMLEADTADLGFVQGLQLGMQLNQIAVQFKDGVDINRELLFETFKEALMTDSVDYIEVSKVRTTLDSMMNIVNERVIAKQREEKEQDPIAVQNKMSEKAYFENLLKNDVSVIKTESGLIYKVNKEGKGEKAQASDRVKVNYVGKLLDGTVFDQSKDPVEFGVQGVIPGFSEGLQLMSKGSNYTLYIPAELGYGIDGAGDKIGPNAALIFEVEVVDIVK